jgi:hypothetical protein
MKYSSPQAAPVILLLPARLLIMVVGVSARARALRAKVMDPWKH